MRFLVTGQDKSDLLIQVTAGAGWTVFKLLLCRNVSYKNKIN